MALQNILNLSPAEEIIFAHEIRSRRAEERGIKLGEERGIKLGEERGRLEGKLERKLEGKLEGKLELVSKLLSQRFGALPPDVTARLQAATPAELEEMALRVLSAPSLLHVVGKPKRKRR